MLIKGDLAEPEKPELNRTLKLFVCLLFRVQKNLVDDAPKSCVWAWWAQSVYWNCTGNVFLIKFKWNKIWMHKMNRPEQNYVIGLMRRWKKTTTMFGSVMMRPISILLVMSIQRTVFSRELNHCKKFCSNLRTAQRSQLVVQ